MQCDGGDLVIVHVFEEEATMYCDGEWIEVEVE